MQSVNELIEDIYPKLCLIVTTLFETSLNKLHEPETSLNIGGETLNLNQFIIDDQVIESKTRLNTYNLTYRKVKLNEKWTAAQNVTNFVKLAQENNIELAGIYKGRPEDIHLSEIDLKNMLQHHISNELDLRGFHFSTCLKGTRGEQFATANNLFTYLLASLQLRFEDQNENLYIQIHSEIKNMIPSYFSNEGYFFSRRYQRYFPYDDQKNITKIYMMYYGLGFCLFDVQPSLYEPSIQSSIAKAISLAEMYFRAMGNFLDKILFFLLKIKIWPQGDLFARDKFNTLSQRFKPQQNTIRLLSPCDIVQYFYCLKIKVSSTGNVVLPMFATAKVDGGYISSLIPRGDENFDILRTKTLHFDVNGTMPNTLVERIDQQKKSQFTLLALALQHSVEEYKQTKWQELYQALTYKIFPATFRHIYNKKSQTLGPTTYVTSCWDCGISSISDFDDKFEISETVLGEGNFGKVVLGNFKSDKSPIAIKIDKDVDSYFIVTECMILSNLSHPNILKIYGLFKTTNAIVCCMELIGGINLVDALTPKKLLPTDVCLHIFKQLADALIYCHSKGIAHRDIKPNNIMSRENPITTKSHNIVLVDWGLAYETNSPKVGYRIGTPLYRPPEMLNKKSFDPFRHDIWSLGATMFVIITRYLPFLNTNDIKLVKLNPRVQTTSILMPIILKIFNINPEDRPTLLEIKEELNKII